MLPRIAASVGLGILALLLLSVSAAAGAGDELFTISIDVGGAEPEELVVREGAVPSQLAKSFADKHDLNDHAASTIAQAILKKAEDLSQDSQQSAEPAPPTDERPILFTLTINVGGTDVELEVRNGDVPQDVAAAFATEHKLDVASRDKIIKAIIDKATQIRSAGGETQPQAAADGGAAAAAAPPSDATAAAPSGGKKVLFSLDVNLGKEGGNVPLPVHAGAVPSELAQQFAAQYGLGEAAVGTLTDAIVKEAKEKGFG